MAAATDSSRALPLLSGPAPRTERAASAPNCHRCGKEFGLLTRRKFCNHCGYSYCGSCCDHQALCPRPTTRPGYETVIVCTYCIEMLSITASGKSQLRSMPVSKLRSYLDAYGIQPKSMLEKGDLVEAILDARGLNGCLSSEQEHHYRTQTIPRRPSNDRNNRNNSRSNIFSSQSNRSGPAPPPRPRSTDPRVDARTNPQRPPVPNFRGSDPYQQNPPYPRPMSPRQDRNERPPPINTTWSPPGPQNAYGTMPRFRSGEASPPPQPRWQTRPQSPPPQPPPDHLRPPSSAGRSRNRSASVPSSEVPPPIPNQHRPPHSPAYAQAPHHQQAPPPPPPLSPRPRASPSTSNAGSQSNAQTTSNTPPPLSTLVDKSKEDISSLNVGTLKSILQSNHVNARMILEKSELVDKVMRLIEMERQERAREQAIHEAEERAAVEAQQRRMEQLEAMRRQQTGQQGQMPQQQNSQTNSESNGYQGGHDASTAVPPTSNLFVERQGLCVVCQDEEANVAIVDCGHLALCMGCSDVIMKSTKECPLCRTRIVTEQRLLRIFKS